MTLEELNNSLKGVFEKCSLDFLENEINILETDVRSTKIKEITFKHPNIIKFPEKLINSTGSLLNKINSNLSLRFNTDGIFILNENQSYSFYFVELKDTLKGDNFQKALNQLLASYVKLKWIMHLTSNILPSKLSFNFYIVSTISTEDKIIASKNIKNDKYSEFIINRKVFLSKQDLKINEVPLSNDYKVESITLNLIEGNSQIIQL